MKLTADHKSISEVISWVGGNAPTRPYYPALAGILLKLEGDTLHAAAADAETRSNAEVEVNGGGDGSVLVPARIVNDILRALPPGSQVEFDTVTDEVVRVTGGRAQFDIRLMPADDFPPDPDLGETTELRIPSSQFVEAVGQVVPSADTEGVRPILNSVRMEVSGGTIELAATDSFRLAVRSSPVDANGTNGATFPLKAITDAHKTAALYDSDVVIRLADGAAQFVFPDRTIHSQMIDGTYPEYRKLIPDEFDNRLILPAQEFADVLDRALVVAPVQSPTVILTINGTSLDIAGGTPDTAGFKEQLDVEYEGEPLSISFNPRFLRAGVKAVLDYGAARAVFRLKDDAKPALMQPAPDEGEPAGVDSIDLTYLVMPVKG